LGMANVIGSLFKSFPTVGGFSRTAVNDQAGAKTGLASIISATLIILTLLFLTPLFYYLPQAILASVIMVAVFGLIDFKEAIHLWSTDRTDFYMLLTTFLTTLGLGIEQGIVVGVVLSLAMVIYRSAYPHIASLGKLPNTNYYRNVERFPQVEQRPDILVMRFDAPLYFANTDYFKDKLMQLVQLKGHQLKLVILNAEAINSLDSSAVHMLVDCVSEFRDAGINIYMAGPIGPVRDIMYKTGLIDLIGEGNMFMHVHDAVAHYDSNNSQQLPQNKHAVQTNVASQTAQRKRWD